MKRLSFILAFAALVSFSCQKVSFSSGEEEIVLRVQSDDDFSVETKATAVTSIPSTLYWGATTGTSTETAKWSTASASTSSSNIYTGKYQTATPTAYNYYIANQTFTVGGDMAVANNDNDVIVGRLAQSTSATPSVTLNHIFARTGTLTCNTQSGYTISNVSWTITSYGSVTGTAGTYNMKSQSWTSRSASLSETAITSSSDFYLLPGEYTFKVSYTLTKGDYSQSFTKSGRATIVAGKVNNISCTAIGGSASEIQIGVSLTAWGTQSVSTTLS